MSVGYRRKWILIEKVLSLKGYHALERERQREKKKEVEGEEEGKEVIDREREEREGSSRGRSSYHIMS